MSEHMRKTYVPLRKALAIALGMTDRQLSDAVACGSPSWVVAAVVLGRRTPADLAGRQSRYQLPRPLPWHPIAEQRRARRLERLRALTQ